MKSRGGPVRAIDANIGYAAAPEGNGIAYSRIAGGGAEHLMRVSFRVRPGFGEREAGYAALTAVVEALKRRGISRVRLALEDGGVVEEVAAHADVPPRAVLPYVRLKCALNQLEQFKLQAAPAGDLTQRARAEIALHSVA
jgi:hypothetical protein